MKKDSALVNRTWFSNTLRNDLLKHFDQLHKDTHISETKLHDQPTELLLAKYNCPISQSI